MRRVQLEGEPTHRDHRDIPPRELVQRVEKVLCGPIHLDNSPTSTASIWRFCASSITRRRSRRLSFAPDAISANVPTGLPPLDWSTLRIWNEEDWTCPRAGRSAGWSGAGQRPDGIGSGREIAPTPLCGHLRTRASIRRTSSDGSLAGLRQATTLGCVSPTTTILRSHSKARLVQPRRLPSTCWSI